MTWLKAIENILGTGEGGVNVKSQIRMARVIRELAVVANEAEWYGIESGGDGQCPICTAIRELNGHGEWCPYKKLSPDAKEVIDELAE